MKTYHLLATAALIVMAGCSQNEITEISPDANPAVSFDIYTGAQTKGTITNNESTGPGIKNTTGFGILAYYTGQTVWSATGSFTPNFMWNQQVKYESTAWKYTPVKYWPNKENDKISFFAYAPYSATQTNGSESYGIKLPANSATAKPTITFTLNTNPTNMVDLVAGYQKDKQKQTTTVDFTLAHLLSRVEFKAKLDTSISSTGETHVFITGMRILGTADNGSDKNAAGANNDSKFYSTAVYDWSAGTWDYTTTTPTKQSAAYSINNVMKLTAASAGGYTKSSIEVTQAGSLTKLFTDNQYLFLIPPKDDLSLSDAGSGIASEKDVRVQVDYDIVTVDSKLSAGHSVTSTSATISLPNKTLKRSKAYEYILTIGLEEVKVTATVTDWATADQVYIPSIDVATANASYVGTAITTLNTAKANNPNCNYFVVNITGSGSGTWSLTATTDKFKSGDQIDLKFSTSSLPSSVTLSGWKAGSAINNSIILTKN
ncbi:MAG: fimbrillin family protein [Parabacteroides sp.]|nr:fimbrillin family protein [Parabacteroides sp.]